MSDSQALADFVGKWRSRWPEWDVAEVFVAATERETVVAWFALLQELTDAAWAGEDPRPGEAKLGWWAEELVGWPQGRRRHPLGLILQRLPAPWTRLATALPSLLTLREPAASRDEAFANAAGLVDAIGVVGSAVYATPPVAHAEALLARHLLLRGDAAVPLQLRARLGDAIREHDLARAWASELLHSWPTAHTAPRPERIFATMLRNRVRRVAAGGAPATPVGRFSTLWSSWRAARG